MPGRSIENVLELIDSNVDLARDEASEYIRTHEMEIAKTLHETGLAVIQTKAGDIQITLNDLVASAA